MASKSAIVMAKMQYTVTYSKRKKHLVSHREKEKEEKKRNKIRRHQDGKQSVTA